MSNISQNEAVPELVTGIIERRIGELEEKISSAWTHLPYATGQSVRPFHCPEPQKRNYDLDKILDRIEKLEQHVLELRAWHP